MSDQNPNDAEGAASAANEVWRMVREALGVPDHEPVLRHARDLRDENIRLAALLSWADGPPRIDEDVMAVVGWKREWSDTWPEVKAGDHLRVVAITSGGNGKIYLLRKNDLDSSYLTTVTDLSEIRRMSHRRRKSRHQNETSIERLGAENRRLRDLLAAWCDSARSVAQCLAATEQALVTVESKEIEMATEDGGPKTAADHSE